MENQNLTEKHLSKNEAGKYILKLDSTDSSIQIPKKFGILITSMLSWEDNRQDNEVSEILRKINCHKTVLYLVGLISQDELMSDPRLNITSDFNFQEKAGSLSTEEFSLVRNNKELHELAKSVCEYGKIYIGQILNSELSHSFIVGRTDDDNFICFDKAGFIENPLKNNKDFKFRVYEIAELLNSEKYQNAKWRFIPIDKI